jgi:hypothetical protein
MYAQNQNIGKPNNLKFWEQYYQGAYTGYPKSAIVTYA